MSFVFPKTIRLCKRRDYQRMASYDARHAGRFIVVELRSNQLPCTRLGITVSRRYGKACSRNRFKRIVREAYRLCRHQLAQGYDINVKPRSAAMSATTKDILNELIQLHRTVP